MSEPTTRTVRVADLPAPDVEIRIPDTFVVIHRPDGSSVRMAAPADEQLGYDPEVDA